MQTMSINAYSTTSIYHIHLIVWSCSLRPSKKDIDFCDLSSSSVTIIYIYIYMLIYFMYIIINLVIDLCIFDISLFTIVYRK